jgi:hypothetical protein
MSSSFLVSASIPTGNNRRIELAGMDLWLWPIVTGRILCENDENYFIEMCDNSIPITFVTNNELKECPFDSNVILEVNNQLFLTFIDQVQVNK